MRVFLAVPLPADIRLHLEDLQRKLRSFRADVRWTAPQSIHLTLKFLGEIDPEKLPDLALELRSHTQMERPFQLQLLGMGAFPNLRSPRVIWCGLGGEFARLQSLQAQVEAACAEVGFAPEERPFQPHLTLGRVRGKTNLQALTDYIRIGNALESTFVVNGFSLYQSILRPEGALYRVLEAIAFRSN